MRLYHFTCRHGHAAIAQQGIVVPWTRLVDPSKAPDGMRPPPVSWFTDLSAPLPDQVGLTRNLVKCDRLAYRYQAVETKRLTPWAEWAEEHASLIVPTWRDDAESFGAPNHWWVADRGVKVKRA